MARPPIRIGACLSTPAQKLSDRAFQASQGYDTADIAKVGMSPQWNYQSSGAIYRGKKSTYEDLFFLCQQIALWNIGLSDNSLATSFMKSIEERAGGLLQGTNFDERMCDLASLGMVMAVDAKIDEEKAAHRFAGAFFPADSLRTEVGASRSTISLGELVALKERFGASIQAIVYRCKDLGIIANGEYVRQFQVFAQRGWRAAPFAEPGKLAPELEEPKRFERLCYRALTERVIGEARAAELLGISVRELDSRLDQMAA
jgi:hypothetical protein